MRPVGFVLRRHGYALGPAVAAAVAADSGGEAEAEEVKGLPWIPEEELRRHRKREDAWVSFEGFVYDITKYVAKHPPCTGLNWAERVAGRRFEDFLGRDAFGPAHLGCGPDANCSKGVKAELAKILAPYKIGQLQAAPPSAAAQLWPDVQREDLQLRLERADGSLLQVFTVDELQKYPKRTKTVTHKCTTSGNLNQQQWSGVWLRDLLSEARSSSESLGYDPLVTCVGMDGFGYSMFMSRAILADVLLAYEQNGEALTTETGGPLRLVKDGQHAKWVEKVIVE